MSARPVSVASNGDCMANTKDNKTLKKECCCVPGSGKTSESSCADFDTICADFDTICEAANVSVSEEDVSTSLLGQHVEYYYYCRYTGAQYTYRISSNKGLP